jgi:CO/xanthine dehydrogenase Mo-binding subunit
MPSKARPPELLEPERYELREPVAYHFTCGRREFLEFAGAGLLIAATAPLASAQRGSSGTTLEARLHLSDDGFATLLSGKVEEGQGPRTELAMAAAEELRLPLDRVRVVLADTNQVPNDGITAGSRTTPSTVPAVRQAAAAARELLLATAAKQWQVDRSKLQVRDGAAVTSDGSKRFTYADLAKSPEFAAAGKEALPSDTPLTRVDNWHVFGTPQVPINSRDIVTGAHRYPSCVTRPGMLYGCVLRPPSYGATLESLDLSAAKQMAGVTVVRDGEFAGCTAPTSYAARKALAALAEGAKWRTQEQPSSDHLFEYLKEHAREERGGRRPQGEENGSIEEGLKQAKKKLQAAFHVPYIQHAPMEPRAAVAEWQDGQLTVWTGTSNPFGVRGQLAEALRVTPDKVRVIVPDMGGGFGGKHTGEVAIEAARLAREAGKPVSLRWTRAEEFMWAYFRPAALIEVEAGLDENGRVTTWNFVNYNSGSAAIGCPYRVPNVRTHFIGSDSPLRQGSYRCLAATANNFARESFFDELAAAAGADPLEFRLAHLDNDRLKNVLQAAVKRFGWAGRSRRKRANTGVGLSCGTEKNSVVAACVEVELDRATGTPRLVEIVEAFECGPILNPAGLRAQVEGCIMMGLGAALREQIQFANGRLTNGSFARYRVPRFRDLPKVDVILVENKDIEPAGAGETPIIAVAPAMANAVFQVTGERVHAMPVRAKPASAG